MKDQPKCQGRVGYGDWGRTRQCTRIATIGDYCYQHDPASIHKRRSETSARFSKKLAERTAPFEKIKALRSLLEEVLLEQEVRNLDMSSDLLDRIKKEIDDEL